MSFLRLGFPAAAAAAKLTGDRQADTLHTFATFTSGGGSSPTTQDSALPLEPPRFRAQVVRLKQTRAQRPG